MTKFLTHDSPLSSIQLAQELLRCAASCGSSIQKSLALPHISQLCHELANDILCHRYQPGFYTRFAVREPKLREIYAPQFRDRLVQSWLVQHATPLLERLMIEDSFANRLNRGPLRAVERAQQLLRRPGHRYVMQLDIQNFFNSIRHELVLQQWLPILERGPWSAERKIILAEVSRAIICHDITQHPFISSGDRKLLASIPSHKRLGFYGTGVGLPIGSLSSQLFANAILSPLDHYIKHELKVRGYVRYMDDLLLMADNRQRLLDWQKCIHLWLEPTGLRLHPNKQYVGLAQQGFDYLGYRVYPHYLHIRRRILASLRARIRWFEHLLAPDPHRPAQRPPRGLWGQQKITTPLAPDGALLRQMLATLNSYWGLLAHAQHIRLRRYLYEHELGSLKRFFIPADEKYCHLRLKAGWQ